MRSFTISTINDIKSFFTYLMNDLLIVFHPDDNFSDYVDIETREPTFTEIEAEYYENLLTTCFMLCEKEKQDIYEICFEIMTQNKEQGATNTESTEQQQGNKEKVCCA